MFYSDVILSASEYLSETENFIERIWGNRVANYDVEHAFYRMNSHSKNNNGRTMDGNYRPQGYEIPEESSLTSHDVAMLGYLATGIGDIAFTEEDEQLLGQYREALQETGMDEAFAQSVRKAYAVDRKGMLTDSFFTTEQRFITQKYCASMTQVFGRVRDAVRANDTQQLATICREGLKSLRLAFNTIISENQLDRYSDCYVCGQILELLDRNPQLSQAVNLSEEDYTYYRGMAEYGKILRNGMIAADRLANPQGLTEEETAQYEKDYQQYHDLSVMQVLNLENRRQSEEYRQSFEDIEQKVIGPEISAAMQAKSGPAYLEFMQTTHTVSADKDSDFIRRLGNLEADRRQEFFEELHTQVNQGKETGRIPVFANLSDVRSKISQVEEKENDIFRKVISDQRTQERIEQIQRNAQAEKEARTRALNEEKLGELRTNFENALEALNNNDSFLRGSSDEYKKVQKSLEGVVKYLNQVSDEHPFVQSRFEQMLEELHTSAYAYMNKKDEGSEIGQEKTQRIGNTYSDNRYNAVLALTWETENAVDTLAEYRQEVVAELSKLFLNTPECRGLEREALHRIVAYELEQSGKMDQALNDYQQRTINLESLKQSVEAKVLPQAVYEKNMRVEAFTPQHLDELFGQIEADSNNSISRGDLITIDGQSIREKIVDDWFANWRGVTEGEFKRYYNENVRELTNRYVEEALRNGQHVEVFVVDPFDGAMTGAVERLYQAGTQPGPAAPDIVERLAESRERVKAVNYAGQLKMDDGARLSRQLFRYNNIDPDDTVEFLDAIAGNPHSTTLQRNTFLTLTALYMATQGHSIDDIASHTPEMTRIRNEASREVLSHLQSNDKAWLARLFVRGMPPLIEELDRRVSAIDFGKMQELQNPKNRGLYLMSHILFDATQEMLRSEKEFYEEAEKANQEKLDAKGKDANPQKKDLADEFYDKITEMGSNVGHMGSYIQLSADFSNGIVLNGNANSVMLVHLEIERRKIAEWQRKNPNTSLSNLNIGNDLQLIKNYTQELDNPDSNRYNEEFANLVGQIEDPNVLRLLGRECIAGRLQESMDIQFGKDGKFTFAIKDAPEIQDVLKRVEGKRDSLGAEITWAENWRKDFYQAGENTVEKYCNHFSELLGTRINRLKKADPVLMRSSTQYKEMQTSAKHMAKVMEEIGSLPEEAKAEVLCLAAGEMQIRAQEYLDYKKADEIGRERSNTEMMRIKAARELLTLSMEMKGLAGKIPQYSEEGVADREAIRKSQRIRDEQIDINNKMDRRYGEQAPAIYRVTGSVFDKPRMVMDEQGVAHEEYDSVVTALRRDIINGKENIKSYVAEKLPASRREALRDTVAKMVILETIVKQRMGNKFTPDQQTVEPGELEKAYAADPQEVLRQLKESSIFHSEMDRLTPERMRDFVVNDGAMGIADTMLKSGLKIGHANDRKAPSRQMSTDNHHVKNKNMK